jgi:hypothetical protein
MTKNKVTVEGKLWSGDLMPVPGHIHQALEIFVHNCCWTDGGEMEAVQDFDGRLWLIDFNPRFPAWIFASTFANMNLPARLLEAGYCHSLSKAVVKPVFADFSRVWFSRTILEVPMVNYVPPKELMTSLLGSDNFDGGKGNPFIKSPIAVRGLDSVHMSPISRSTEGLYRDLSEFCSQTYDYLLNHQDISSISTPRVIMSSSVLSCALDRIKARVNASIVRTCRDGLQMILFQPFISVKTQTALSRFAFAGQKTWILR